MKKLWVLLTLVCSSEALSHGLDSFQRDDFLRVYSSVGISDECPLDQDVFWRLLNKEIRSKGIQLVEFDSAEATLFLRIECFENTDPKGFLFYTSLMLAWIQGELVPELDLRDYYGYRETSSEVAEDSHRVIQEGVARYLELSTGGDF